MFSLTNHTAFVTGSTQGIGQEMAIALSEAGASVVLHGLHDDAHANTAKAACKHLAEFVAGDLATNMPGNASNIAAQALKVAPEIDLLVCNAGIFIDQPFLEMDFATFQRTLNVNVAATFILVQHFARHWLAHGIAGRVLITGSINGKLSEPQHVAYDTSKGAVDAMVRSLAVELAPHGIRVNGVAPGLFETPLTSQALQQAGVREWMEIHTPNGQVPGPAAIRGATVFLLSDAAEHMHGQMIYVDGGMSIWQQPDRPSQ